VTSSVVKYDCDTFHFLHDTFTVCFSSAKVLKYHNLFFNRKFELVNFSTVFLTTRYNSERDI